MKDTFDFPDTEESRQEDIVKTKDQHLSHEAASYPDKEKENEGFGTHEENREVPCRHEDADGHGHAECGHIHNHEDHDYSSCHSEHDEQSCRDDHPHHEQDDSREYGHHHHGHEDSRECRHHHHEHEDSHACGHHHHEQKDSCECGHDYHGHGISCGCDHDHHDHSHGEEKPHVMIIRLIVSAVLLAAGLFFPEQSFLRFLFSLLSAAVIGYDILWGAVKNILNRELLDEMFLMTAACVGAFVLKEYTEGAMVLLLFQLGEFLQDRAVDQSRKSISSLVKIRPEEATVLRDGKEMRVAVDDVRIGETLLVKPGERIPLDGKVIEGESFLDTTALTGESVPRAARAGEEVLSGCVNLRGVLYIRTERLAHDSAVSRILELVEDATEHKSHADKFITRFARIYTPTVVGAAVLLFLISGAVTGNWAEWLRRSLTFLVISCPCALVISVPLSYFTGIGRASRHGILVKGSNILEELSHTGIVAMDKTGTVTKGVFEVVAVHPEEMNESELLEYAAGAEKYSTHPIADAIRESCPGWDSLKVDKYQEIAGQGIIAEVKGHRVTAGNERLMAAGKIACHDCHLTGTIVHIAVDGKYEGHLIIADVVKESAEEAVRMLKKLGVRKTVMLTGDRKNAAEDIGKKIGADEVYAELNPEEKVNHVRRLMEERKDPREKVVFVGDGINDAPVLVSADLGVAMGASGSDAAVEAADIVLIDDDPVKLAEGIRLAGRTQRIVRENIVFSISVKVLVMILGALGVVPLWLAVFSDVGVCLLAVFNAIR